MNGSHEVDGPSFLVDSNVWIDAFIDRSARHELANSFLKEARLRDAALFTPVESTKDVFYLVTCELKRMQREETGAATEAFACAASEIAWSCVTAMRRFSTVVGADASDVVEATALRADHDDYEDNLIVAAALRACVTYIVSSDKTLQRHSCVPCIGLEEALKLVAG